MCGASFKRRPAVVRAGYGRYCSLRCSGLAQRTRVERKCEICGKSFEPKLAEVAKGKGRFCSRGCFDQSRRGNRRDLVAHRLTRSRGHPLAPPSGIVAVSRLRLYDKIGPGQHPCHWCAKPVRWQVGRGVRDQDVLVVDHLDHDPTNDAIDNLVPSCNSCNAHRRQDGRSAIIRDDEDVVYRSGKKVRAIRRRCQYCGVEFLAAAAQVKIDKARFCSRSCARRRDHSS